MKWCILNNMTENRYRAFVFDVDGTLTDIRTGQFVPSAVEAIRLLQEKGYPVIIGTGRPVYLTHNVAAAGIRPDYYVASNGQLIADGTGKTLHQECFDRDLYHAIHEFCQKHHLGFFWKFEHGVRVDVEHPNMEKIFTNPAYCHYGLPDDDSLPNAGALVGDDNDRALFESEFKGKVECVDGGLLLYDINKLNVSKRNGLQWLLEYLEIPVEEVMAFGDSENDIEMIDYAGMGVVMADGMKVCLEHADYVTEETYNDGVMKALQHFGIL